MANLYLKITSKDRIGLVLDISTILNKYHLNIAALNVLPNIMYLELDTCDEIIAKAVIREIKQIWQVISVTKQVTSSNVSPQNIIKTSSEHIEKAFEPIIHHGISMQKLIKTAKRSALSSSTILLLGESGTGKELFAKAIHHASPRAKYAFLPINCAAIPETLLESELFGYEEGAFTGANKIGKQGLFEAANQGTIFLDEIGELPIHFQVKLLRVLQEKKIKRVGGNKEIAIDVRIIAATHQDLTKKIKENQFREDLFYRLNVLPLYIPPLRKRKEDIPSLSQSLLNKRCQQLTIQNKRLSAEAINQLIKYSWPGNIRELENIIERLVIFSADNTIDEHSVIRELKQYRTTINHNNETTNIPDHKHLKEILDEYERTILCDAIKKYGTSRKIGKKLGLSHTAVLNRIKKHHIYITTEIDPI